MLPGRLCRGAHALGFLPDRKCTTLYQILDGELVYFPIYAAPLTRPNPRVVLKDRHLTVSCHVNDTEDDKPLLSLTGVQPTRGTGR